MARVHFFNRIARYVRTRTRRNVRVAAHRDGAQGSVNPGTLPFRNDVQMKIAGVPRCRTAIEVDGGRREDTHGHRPAAM
jgi:hypothetical protein